MSTGATGRGYGITKTDMEASRLVFVYLRDAKPKRKVAVPVPDWYSWNDFVQQVKTKLKIVGVKEIYMASTGQKVSSLDEVQDIDELCVVDGPELVVSTSVNGGMSDPATRSGMGATTSEILPQETHMYRQGSKDKHKIVVADGVLSPTGVDADDQKYAKRSTSAGRFLQRLLPSVFSPGLPVSAKDLKSEDKGQDSRLARRRRGKRSIFTIRNLILLVIVCSCFAFMIYLFLKVDIQT